MDAFDSGEADVAHKQIATYGLKRVHIPKLMSDGCQITRIPREEQGCVAGKMGGEDERRTKGRVGLYKCSGVCRSLAELQNGPSYSLASTTDSF